MRHFEHHFTQKPFTVIWYLPYSLDSPACVPRYLLCCNGEEYSYGDFYAALIQAIRFNMRLP